MLLTRFFLIFPGSSNPPTTPEPSTTSTESPTRNTTLPGPSTASTTDSNDTITTNSSTTEQPPSNVTSTASTTEGNDTITTNSSTTEQPPSNVTSQTTSTATLTTVPFYLSYHIVNRVFNDSLLNDTTAYYQELNETIGKMYENIYGCNETCALRDEYQGYEIIRFRQGSVATDTRLNFMTRKTPEELADTARETFEAVGMTEWEQLNLTSIQGSSTPINGATTPEPTTAQPTPQTGTPVSTDVSNDTTTPERSTASPETTTSSSKTTPLNPVPFYLAYHIMNREFDNTLLDPTTMYYKQINESIGKMYENIYGCSACVRRDEYRGYSILNFGPGSIAVWTVLFFDTKEPPAQLAEALHEIFEQSSLAQREQLELISIQGSSTPIPVPEPPERVPGWGIALLVLVCILLLLAIIAFLILIIYRCRRSHRGNLDLLNSRDAYHPMSEYPTYHTHGRYAAPFTKPNPYDAVFTHDIEQLVMWLAGTQASAESSWLFPAFNPRELGAPRKQPTNGTSPFSYTNPAVANDNL
ncbi:UNVERIFIED_CONTAM: hypothetical protein K2H54_018788 [Gekko kuhli]